MSRKIRVVGTTKNGEEVYGFFLFGRLNNNKKEFYILSEKKIYNCIDCKDKKDA